MREIKLKRLVLDNFKGTKHREVDFPEDRSIVKGRNRVGKTTLYDSCLWLLFDKDNKGNSATNVRPKDENGVDIDFIDISVEATFEVDGQELSLKKTQSQKWVKKRGSTEQTFQGNENKFEICGVPKAQKDYKAFIEENFCNENVFLFCSNVNSFFNLDTKKRRAKLVELVGDVSDADVIAQDDEFKHLAMQLKVGTVDELLTRSKATIKRLNEDLKAIPVRIDELEKSKVDIDVAELELHRTSLNMQISEIDSKLADNDKLLEESRLLDSEIYRVESAIATLKNEYMAKQDTVIREYNEKLRKIDSDISITEMQISGFDEKIKSLESDIAVAESEKNELAKKWKEAKERLFDDSSLVCPYCKQEYTEDKKESIRADFESHKQKELADIVSRGNDKKAYIEDKQNLVADLVEQKSQAIKELAELKSQKEALGIAPQIDSSDNYMKSEEYQKLFKEKQDLEAKKTDNTSIHTVAAELKNQRNDLNNQLLATEREIGASNQNVQVDERIEELQRNQRSTSQSIANEQAQLDLLERFNKAKMDMLTEAVNKYFDVCRVVLFSEQINGGYANVCKIIGNKGIDYENGLNHGARILADLDILNAFQKMNDVKIPVFADDTESVDADRLPTEVRTQTIYLRRDDTDLEVC